MNKLQLSKALDRASMLGDKETAKSILDQRDNPEKYTTNAPNTGSKAAFSTQNWRGAGRDGLKRGEDTFYYKLEDRQTGESKPALDLNPTAEATEDTSPKAESTSNRAFAKERAQQFKAEIDGTQGSDFSAI